MRLGLHRKVRQQGEEEVQEGGPGKDHQQGELRDTHQVQGLWRQHKQQFGDIQTHQGRAPRQKGVAATVSFNATDSTKENTQTPWFYHFGKIWISLFLLHPCSEPELVSLRHVVAEEELLILHQAVEADVVQLQIELELFKSLT